MKAHNMACFARIRKPLATMAIMLLIGFLASVSLSSCGSTRTYPTPNQTQQLKHQKKGKTKYGRASKGKIRIKENYVIRK